MSIIDEAKKKLHSENGSSLLIALLLFFVCLILSMSILSAAVASRVRIKDEKERNQELLGMESAIGVLTEGLGKIEYYRRERQTETDTWQVEVSWIKISGVFNGGSLKGKLKSLIEKNLESLPENQGALNNEGNRFSIYLEGYDDKVYILPQVGDDYDLTFYVELKREDDSYDKVYKISYAPAFDEYLGGQVGAQYDAQTRWHLSVDNTVRELCLTWEKDPQKPNSYVLQRIVN